MRIRNNVNEIIKKEIINNARQFNVFAYGLMKNTDTRITPTVKWLEKNFKQELHALRLQIDILNLIDAECGYHIEFDSIHVYASIKSIDVYDCATGDKIESWEV